MLNMDELLNSPSGHLASLAQRGYAYNVRAGRRVFGRRAAAVRHGAVPSALRRHRASTHGPEGERARALVSSKDKK
jgi:hypothetical protein